MPGLRLLSGREEPAGYVRRRCRADHVQAHDGVRVRRLAPGRPFGAVSAPVVRAPSGRRTVAAGAGRSTDALAGTVR
ncbi:hypothetical protein CELD12_22010 [Cellulomonas sp. NTE-D12]|nr:hypothetical protein CELD12_22010 [Cellulomonas sp. NTE-D12]